MLISLIFYIRGQFFGEQYPNFSLVIPLVAMIMILSLIIVNLLWNYTVVYPKTMVSVFFFISCINISLNAFFDTKDSFLFAKLLAEMVLNFIVYYVAFTLVFKKIMKPELILTLIKYTGLIAVAFMLVSFLEADQIRRLKNLATAVNFLGHSLSIMFFIVLYHMHSSGKLSQFLLNLIILFFVISCILLTGSRSTLLGLFVCNLIVLIVKFQEKRYLIMYSLIFVIAGLILTYIIHSGKFDSLIARFQMLQIETAASSRFGIWEYAFSLLDLRTLAIGKPILYSALEGRNSLHPHNMMLSIFFFLGFIPFVLYVYVVIQRAYILLTFVLSGHTSLDLVLLTTFLMTLVYSSLSGEFTRVMTIFFVLGVLDGYFKTEDLAHKLAPT